MDSGSLLGHSPWATRALTHDLETKQQQRCQLILGKFKVLFVKSDVLWPGKLLAELPLAATVS